MKRQTCNFKFPIDIYEYLKKISTNKYTSMSDYLIQLILKDKEDQEKNKK